MLEEIHALHVPGLPPVPLILPGDGGRTRSEFRNTLGSDDRITGELIRGIQELTPFDVSFHIVRIFIGDPEVIVNVTIEVGTLSAATSIGRDWIHVIEGPGDPVDIVATLFDDSVSTQPGEIVPILDLPFRVPHPVGTSRRIGHRFHR